MEEEIKRKRGRPPKSQATSTQNITEINSQSSPTATVDSSYEFNSYTAK